MRYKSIIIFAVILLIVAQFINYTNDTRSTGVEKDSQIVISLGEDLNEGQKKTVTEYFSKWQQDRNAHYITVSNKEERQYLQGLVDIDTIGTRAISSAYVELLEQSKGIEVQTNNITAITPFMYANALTTAGIENARVIVAAPFKVSGTAGLTGILKAFESASGERLNENAKQTAHQEIAETSELGKKIGQNSAEKVIYETKRQVINKRTNDPQEIRNIILDVTADLNVKLSEEEIQKITALMQKMNNLDISISRLNDQLQGLERTLVEVTSATRETTSLLKQIIDILTNMIQNVRNAVL